VREVPATPVEPLALLWSFKTGGPVKSSAAIYENKVFVGSSDASIYALDLAAGKMLWTFKTGDAVESSPLVLNGVVYVGSADSYLYALDASSGALKWKYKAGDKILGAPNWVHREGGDCILVGSYDNNVHCVDAATGKRVWAYDTENFVNGAPAVADGRVVFGGCDAKIHALAIGDGKLLKELEVGAYIAGSCAVGGKNAYAGHYGNQVVCANLEEGKLTWTSHDSEEAYFSTPALTDTRVLIGGRDRKLHCLDRATGRSVWTFQTQGFVDSSPVVWGDRVLVGSDDGHLYVISLVEGKECWSYEIGKPISASPAVADGMVVIGSEDGSVYGFGPAAKR
jgi:outer membrane protein assembly factor BamB